MTSREFFGEASLMLFAFLVSILGFSIALWMLERLAHHSFISKSEMTKIGTAHLAVVFALLFVLPRSHRATWIATSAPLLFTAGAAFTLMRCRSRKFRTRVRDALAVISLKMKSGRSFRQSLAETCAESDELFRAKLGEIANAVVFSQHSRAIDADHFISEVVEELTRIDQNPHASIKRLSVYRQKLRIEDDFRRKSGQVLARIRAQSFVMTGLYFAVFIFMLWKFGWEKNAPVLMTSALLFAIGAAWIYLGGRKLKWKV